jgi:hypothetical protein
LFVLISLVTPVKNKSSPFTGAAVLQFAVLVHVPLAPNPVHVSSAACIEGTTLKQNEHINAINKFARPGRRPRALRSGLAAWMEMPPRGLVECEDGDTV